MATKEFIESVTYKGPPIEKPVAPKPVAAPTKAPKKVK